MKKIGLLSLSLIMTGSKVFSQEKRALPDVPEMKTKISPDALRKWMDQVPPENKKMLYSRRQTTPSNGVLYLPLDGMPCRMDSTGSRRIPNGRKDDPAINSVPIPNGKPKLQEE